MHVFNGLINLSLCLIYIRHASKSWYILVTNSCTLMSKNDQSNNISYNPPYYESRSWISCLGKGGVVFILKEWSCSIILKWSDLSFRIQESFWFLHYCLRWRRGLVVRALDFGSESPGIKIWARGGTEILSLFTQQWMGTFQRNWRRLGGKRSERRWAPTLICRAQETVGL